MYHKSSLKILFRIYMLIMFAQFFICFIRNNVITNSIDYLFITAFPYQIDYESITIIVK